MKPLHGTPLKRFVRDFQRTHPLTKEIKLILQSVAYPANVGSVFRLADGAGVSEVILCGITPQPPNPTIDKVSRNKHRRVPWRYEKEAVDAIKQVRDEGFMIFGVELVAGAVLYNEVSYPEKICFVVGHEDHGITKQTLEACDHYIFLPMYGKGLSLNVHVAASIVVYHAIQSPY